MCKVTYQVHGAIDVRSKVFGNQMLAEMWCESHNDMFSFFVIEELAW